MFLLENKPILYSLFVFTGSAMGISVKILQSIKSLDSDFKHPIIYSFILFLSETTGLITYYCYLKKEDMVINKFEDNFTKKEMNIYLISIPSIFDLFSSCFGILSYENLAASITTMFDGGNTIGVFLLSIFFLKNKHSKHNFFGVCLLIIGLFFISLSAINDDQEQSKGLKETIFGIIFCILCNIFTSFHAISEEYLLKTRKCHPIKLLGFEGLFGSIFSMILMLFFSLIKFGKYFEFICIKDQNGNLYIENFFFAFNQIINKKIILFIIVFQFFVLIIYNYCYITITNVANATSNIVLYNLTSLFIWIFFLLPIDKKNQEKFGILQCIGFLILIFGVCIYNELLFSRKKYFELKKTENPNDDLELTDGPIIV